MKKNLLRILVAAMLIAALIIPSALASGSFEAVVTAKKMKVYGQDEPHALLGTLSKGTVVTVIEYNKKAALIRYNGYTGIAKVGDLKAAAKSDGEEESHSAASASASELANAKVVVTTKSAKVYNKANKSSGSVKVKAGVKLNLLSVSDGIAKVERNGAVGYMDARYLKEEAAQTVEEKPVEEVVQYEDVTVMTADSCKIYAKPSTSSSHTTVPKGTKLTLLAVKGNCAQVRLDGKVCYTDKRNLTTEITTAEITTPGNTSSQSGDVFSGSNEQIIFKFLTQKMGYNTAAACGILSNIKYESDYKTSCVSDNGTSYGITQWHAGRKTKLIDWCNTNGYDYTSLKGQLCYLQHELKTSYPAVHDKMKNVPNTAQGAYDAAYYFCYYYEVPSNRAARSVTRGNYARDTLWGKYRV